MYADVLAEDWSGDEEHEVLSWSEVLSIFVDAPHILLTCIPLFLNGFMVSSVSLKRSRISRTLNEAVKISYSVWLHCE